MLEKNGLVVRNCENVGGKSFYYNAFKASLNDYRMRRESIEETTIFTSQVIDSFIKVNQSKFGYSLFKHHNTPLF